MFQIFFIFTPKIGEDEPILTSIFFRWVGSTTNQFSSDFFFSGGVPSRMLGKMLEQRSVVRSKTSRKHGSHGCEVDPLEGRILVIFSTCFLFNPRSKQIKRLILLIFKNSWPKPVEGTVLVVYLPLFTYRVFSNIPAR